MTDYRPTLDEIKEIFGEGEEKPTSSKGSGSTTFIAGINNQLVVK